MAPRKMTQAQIAYQKIKKMLISRELAPGNPILELDLAEQLNMSRTPIHEAIRKLEMDGYVDIVERKGAFVKYLSIPELIKCYEVSEGLEGMVAYLVADLNRQKKLKKSALKQLEALVVSMDDPGTQQEPNQWIEMDTKFHDLLHDLCENQFLIEHLTRLKNHFNMISVYITPYHIDKREANQEHRDLVKYIIAGDPDKAREIAMLQRRHIRNKLTEVIGNGAAMPQ